MWKKPIPTQAEIKEQLEQLRLSSTTSIVCVQCGMKLHGEYHYCPNCGNGVEGLSDIPSVKYALICKICHKEIVEPFSKYCTNCGQRIRKTTEIIKSIVKHGSPK
ncbi:hypothetical protein LCGC14_0224250 [marine sediment metagenome]|uniref:DZANK-type domain-containing protein n=1 Tax=marine sediment metagenome TaxID=412755 RepID=A0A0F9UTP8_9ZZZZ